MNFENYDITINIHFITIKEEENEKALLFISIPIFIQSDKYSHGSWQTSSGGLHPSISWAIAKKVAEHGAELAFTYQGEALGKRVITLGESVESKFMSIITML